MRTDPSSWSFGDRPEVSPAALRPRCPDAAHISGTAYLSGDGSAR
ncbi:hypothetical protein AB0N87_25765 [Streptomyces sp. NPDC093228]|nr:MULTISPECIES: hypothetical protein [unclassified Streptomyces]MDX3258474.1 hypothetical protein [Streptomyces sp. MI02-2A]REE58115.1 hypothetical protein BX257_0527 [Streptomyces sp. 3212.3]